MNWPKIVKKGLEFDSLEWVWNGLKWAWNGPEIGHKLFSKCITNAEVFAEYAGK